MYRPNFLPTQPIRIQERTATDANGKKDWAFDDITEVGGVPVVYSCEWKNAHGAEVLQADVQKVEKLATLTMFYMPGITMQHYIIKGDNSLTTDDELKAARYEIIGYDNIEERNMILVLKVKKAVSR